ncbi:Uncharacterised protein [Mycobacteroides abscessus subsp. abscessus]|nr:Uncharacterised protein [Mycobacteroides abscessus subsp. abscessus]
MAGVGAHPGGELGDRRAHPAGRAVGHPTHVPIDAAIGDRLGEDAQQRPTVGGLTVVELLRHPDPSHRGHRLGDLVGTQMPHLALLGEHGREPGDAVAVRHRGDDHRSALDPPRGQGDDVADLQRRQGLDDLALLDLRLRPRLLLLRLGDLTAQGRVLPEVAPVAVHRLLVRGDRRLVLPDLAGEADDGLVGLELRERGLEDLRGIGRAHPGEQVRRHVVGGSERGSERVRPVGGEAGDLADVHRGVPDDDGVADPVDAAAAGAPGQLRVLPRGDRDVGFAVELDELLEHDRAGGHVDAQRQRLRGEDDLDDPGGEELLDELLELRDHARVVGGDAAEEALAERVVAEDPQILRRQLLAQPLESRVDDDVVLAGVEVGARGDVLLDGLITAVAGEDEHDRREHPRLGEGGDDLGPAGAAEPGAIAALALRPGSAVRAGRVRERRVDALGVVMGEEVVHPVADEGVVDERDRAVGGRDDGRRPPDLAQPRSELLDVGHGRRERDDLDAFGQVDDHLLPHGTAEPVGEVVDLVEDDEAEVIEAARVVVEHVAQDLGGHDDDRRIPADRRVPGEESDVLGAVDGDEIGELLVAQRLDRGGVEHPGAGVHREVDGELGDDRLAGPGRRGDEDVLALLELLARLDLEVVELEVGAGEEPTQRGLLAFGPSPELRVRLRRALGLGVCGGLGTRRSGVMVVAVSAPAHAVPFPLSSSSSSGSTQMPWATSLRLRRRSLRMHTTHARQNSVIMGMTRKNIDIASGVGVAIAAKMKTIMTMMRHDLRIRVAERIPSMLSPTMSTGRTNAMPKTTMMIMTNVR